MQLSAGAAVHAAPDASAVQGKGLSEPQVEVVAQLATRDAAPETRAADMTDREAVHLAGLLERAPYKMEPRHGRPALIAGMVCNGRYCFGPSVYGALGLVPRRTYRVVHAKQPAVCRTIADALNDTIRAAPSDIEAIWRQYHWAGSVYPFASTNILFSSRIFIRWHPFRGEVFQDAPGSYVDKWLIAPVLNDGVPRLVTRVTGPVVRRTGFAVDLWKFTPTDLQEMKPDSGELRFPVLPEQQAEFALSGDQDPVKSLIHRLDNHDILQRFPNLPSAVRSTATWMVTYGGSSEVEFAEIDRHFFVVLLSEISDAIVVANLTDNETSIACYIDSSISHEISRPLVFPRSLR